MHYHGEPPCWMNYLEQPYIWIIRVPMMTAILVSKRPVMQAVIGFTMPNMCGFLNILNISKAISRITNTKPIPSMAVLI